MKTWVKAGMGCVLLWAGAGVASVRGDELPAKHCTQNAPRQCGPSEIQQLESEARALVVAEGCTDVSQCQTAPLGARACGGPRDYVVYCAATTDEQKLQRALDRLAKREDQYNRQCGIVSICSFVAPPEVELVDGMCRAVEPPTNTLP